MKLFCPSITQAKNSHYKQLVSQKTENAFVALLPTTYSEPEVITEGPSSIQVQDIELDIGNGELLPPLIVGQDVDPLRVRPCPNSGVQRVLEMMEELTQSVENHQRRSRRRRYLLAFHTYQNPPFLFT